MIIYIVTRTEKEIFPHGHGSRETKENITAFTRAHMAKDYIRNKEEDIQLPYTWEIEELELDAFTIETDDEDEESEFLDLPPGYKYSG